MLYLQDEGDGTTMMDKKRAILPFLGAAILLLLAACSAGKSEAAGPTHPPGEESASSQGEAAAEEPMTQDPNAEEKLPAGAASEQEQTHVDPVQCTVDLAPGFQAGANPNLIEDGARPGGSGLPGWETDWDRHTVPYDEILSGGVPRDGIPPIYDPKFVPAADAGEWLADTEPVIAFELGGSARAYPLQVMTWHEITNDTVCGIPVAVTFCPLCNSALVFDRRVNGEVYEFGVSGLLRNSDLVMWDHQTESLWQQFTGEGIIGTHAGDQLAILPSSIVSFADFKASHPDGIVLSRDTGYTRRYGQNPYSDYDQSTRPFLFRGDLDERLPAMMRVVGVAVGDAQVAYPYSILSEQGVINDTLAGQDLVIFFAFGTTSALGATNISEAQDVGAAAVFDPNLDGQKLTFVVEDGVFTDEQTGSTWNLLGQATGGELAGKQLEPLVHSDHFWFSWAAFFPDTAIYE